MSHALRLRPGCAYSFSYPRHNFHGVLSSLERRRLLVENVRDLKQEPLERQTFDVQPLLRRGRYLVTGQDLDKQQERTFYVESMRAVKPITVLTVT